MSLNEQRQDDEPLSQQSRQFILKMVERYMRMPPQKQQAHLKYVERSLQQKKKIQESKSTERTSQLSSQDHSPIHFKKTTSFITEEKVGEFKTQPQQKPRIHSQQQINESKEQSLSQPNNADYSFISQQYDLSRLQANEENLYFIPEKYDTPEKQNNFCKKVIKPLKFLGIPGTKQNYNLAIQSRVKINKNHPKNFKEVPNLGLFYMDLVTEIGRARNLGKQYMRQLKELNKLLIFKIQIGMKTQRKQLLKAFEIHWQSLVEIILQRIWDQESQEEHGLDFFTCKDNLKKIKKIMLLGNKLTQKFYESLKEIQLPQLQVLEMNFEQQVDHEELFRIFQVISAYNDKFEIHLVTGLKNKNELPPFLTEKYDERIYLIDKNKKPFDKLQNQRPVQKIKYEKPAYQIAHENQQKIGPKDPKDIYIPKNAKKPNIDLSLPLLNQGVQNGQQVPNQGMSNIPYGQQIPGVNNPTHPIINPTLLAPQQQFSNIGFVAKQNSSIKDVNIGNTLYNQKTQHHHHTNIHNQPVQRIIEKHYMTDTESRSGRNNYGGNRSQNGGGRNYYRDSSSDDEPRYHNNGYSYRGQNNYNYKKKYYNNNRYNGYNRRWFQDDY